MDRKVLLNQLQLVYSPLCNYDFTSFRSDLVIQNVIQRSKLYIIAQRSEIRFDNIRPNLPDKSLEFEIRQQGNPNVLFCKMPLFQEHLAKDPTKEIILYFGSNDPENVMDEFGLSNIHGFKLYEEYESDETFIAWFSPEKFLQNFWKGILDAEVSGDIHHFTKYKVHYVGQSTKQNIWKRLTGHNKLQDILSLEYPFSYGSLPTHEIVILMFGFKENLQFHTWGRESPVEDMVDSFLGKNLPNERTIFLDAEKALINSMQPKYNQELFKKYPVSKDGLSKHKYNSISYSFSDPITLVYDKGEIEGGLSFFGGDALVVKENSSVELFKHQKK